ncbi:zinc finger protein 43-like [Diabrotica virgifera virgifera]|uniref:C2H2-type domain-containing protein n=1 Tax=Diabrotica virgifera virgifera TaxID=50390 RepID=A0ABM5JZT5_DIAVI|nr:zinc finger protein 43-like [Diabrotica virgifera virgifera]
MYMCGFHCTTCDKTYKLKKSLGDHKRKYCQKDPQFACPCCPYKAKLKGTLKRHILRRHERTKILKNGPIYVPSELATIAKSAKKKGEPYEVTEMPTEEFFDWKKIAKDMGANFNVNEKGQKVLINDIKWIKVKKGEPGKIVYKTSFKQEEFDVINITKKLRSQREKPTLILAYEQAPPIPIKKKNDLMRFHCDTCDKIYKLKSSLREHKRKECQKEPQFACSYCSYKAKLKGNLKRHILLKHQERTKILKNGPIYVPSELATIAKSAKKKGEPYEVTEMPTEEFFDWKKIAKDMGANFNVNEKGQKVLINDIKWIKVKKGEPGKIVYKTSFKQEEFDVINITKKLRSQREKPTLILAYEQAPPIPIKKKNDLMRGFPCNICNKLYKLKGSLTRHQKLECQKEPNIVNCNFSKLQLFLYFIYFLGPFVCLKCNITYSQAYNLRRHIQFECGVERKFTCEFCNSKFKRKDHLLSHKRSLACKRMQHL